MIKDYGRFALFAIFLICSCDRTSSECAQLTPCSCVYQDGQGYDLNSLTHLGILEATSNNSSYTYYFHPCKNIIFPSTPANQTSECNIGDGVSLCAYDPSVKTNVSLGLAQETHIEIKGTNPFFIIHHGVFTTMIELLCCSTCGTRLTVSKVQPIKSEHHLVLMSESACKITIHPRGLSTGSILVILFFVFGGIYFIGGAIALKLLRGATGWEMLPNHEFWCGLPGLVKDGILFTFQCCRTGSYESI